MHPFQPSDPKLSIINNPPSWIKGPELLHDLVRTSSNSHHPAIDFLENGTARRTLSYETLHALSDALAIEITHVFSRLENASPVIPVFLPQSPELYIALLAILKAGKAFCPLGLDIPTERLNFILRDVSAQLLITNSFNCKSITSSVGVEVFLVDQKFSAQRQGYKRRLPIVCADDLAYVLYTSGSTGLPKAVSVSHRAVTQSLLAHDRHIPEFARFLQFAAPTFDVSIFEIFFPLFRGCTIAGCVRSRMLGDLPGVIATLEVDAAELTPTVAGNLLRGRASVPGLNLLLTIGEMLTTHVIEEYGGNDKQKSLLWAMYGPTEAAIHCTLQPNLACASSVNNIGLPLDTVSAFIMQPVSEKVRSTEISVQPIGEIGELVLGGPQVAEEYLNRPDLTSKSFVEHSEFGYLYRTGDKARLNSGGSLECLGRIESGQVKLRGQRVEIGEIENIISKVEECRAALIMMIDDALVAFCAADVRELSSAAVLEACKRWLPSYMVPADVCILEQMPQLASGKVDKGALKKQYQLYQRGNVATPLPNDEVICDVFSILQRHLQNGLTLSGNLHSFGLDSLQSIRIASSLREIGYNLGAIDVLSASNLEELTLACRKIKADGKEDSQCAHEISSSTNLEFPELNGLNQQIERVLPCTPLQEAMLAETVQRPSAYCNWIEVEISHRHTYAEISHCIESLAGTNEILRTGFYESSSTSGSFVQIVWSSLGKSQFSQVNDFSRSFSLSSVHSLLKPLSVQISVSSKQPRILFLIHHALYDGWSFDLLLQDFHNLLREGTVSRRPQYREVVTYYAGLKKSKRLDHAAYWTDFMRNYLPTPFPNLNGKTINTRQKRCSIFGTSCVNSQSLFRHSKQLLLNPQVFFQAATSYVLSLYYGSPDSVMGVVTSGRTIPVTGIEEIMGPCITSLPFRLNFSSLSSIRDVLDQTQRSNREMIQHCTMPLRDITKICGFRPTARLFDILFVWQQSLISAANRNISVQTVDGEDDTEFKLTLEFEPRDDYILYRATYDPATIPESQTYILLRQIDDVVHHFLLNTGSNFDTTRQCFSASSLSVANPWPTQEPILQGPSSLVEKWALEHPSKPALLLGELVDGIITPKKTLSYGELNDRANRLAFLLNQHGVESDQLVCVLMEKSIDLYIAILAVLKVGAGYLPVVPGTPLERVKLILADAQVAMCLSDFASSAMLKQQNTCTILDVDRIQLCQYPGKNLKIPYNGSHLAYAVFTSGSTGNPKGVLVTQDNLMSNLKYLSSIYPTSTGDRMLQFCSQAFDVSVFEIFFTWSEGLCLCTARMDVLLDNLENAINCLGITHLSLTPTVAALIDQSRVPKVKFLVTAGEAVTERVKRTWAGKGLFQGYGPSETTNICTVRQNVMPEDLINNIGPPFDNTSVFVLDTDDDTILPRGAIGELCFGGRQVFRGYLNKPELNAQKIINHSSYGRIYRSGDLGLLLHDDCILFTGRSDDQIKIRGQRIEPGEITSIVLDKEAVKDCATLLFQHDQMQQLVAYWVPKDSFVDEFMVLHPKKYCAQIQSIFESLSLKVPSYMIPTYLVPVSRIPMTSQAKIDKRLLQSALRVLSDQFLEFATSSFNEKSSSSEFVSEREKRVAEALAHILDISASRISRNSSFFALGLDSISGIRFVSYLRKAGIANLPVSTVLQNPTIERICSLNATLDTTAAKPAEQGLRALASVFNADQVSGIRSELVHRGHKIEKILPCTPLQEAMLSKAPISSESLYCNTMVFDVTGDLSSLQDAWVYMMRRHESLRTAFVPSEDSKYAFAQVVLEHEPVEWDYLTADVDPESYGTNVLGQLLESYKPPVHLAVQKSNSKTKIIFYCHHSLYDGVAISKLLEEIQDAYFGRQLSPPVPFERYLQHMVLQDLDAADAFWGTTLNGIDPSFFPRLNPKAAESASHQISTTICLRTSLDEALEASHKGSVSLLSILQTAWAKLLHFYFGESDICFGNVVSGRTLSEKDLDRIVAPCFNTLPVRSKFDTGNTNSDLVKHHHDYNIDCLPFQLTPLRRIQNAVLGEGYRLFDTLFILQQPTTTLNKDLWRLEQDSGSMDVPVACEIFQDVSERLLKMTLHYQTSLLSAQDAGVLIRTYDSILKSLIEFPNSPANDSVGLPAQLRAESNIDWSRQEPPSGKLLHSAMEHNAMIRPDDVALDFLHVDGRKTTWTFMTLNEKANQIGHALVQRNIGPENIVPIYMQKSPQFYASILGVLKAGAAFAPIYPDLPESRIKFMVSELRPSVVLSIKSFSMDFPIQIEILNVDSLENFPKSNPTAPPRLSETSLAYCLYTSGSTGLPKAVSMEHCAPIQTIECSRNLIPWTFGSRLLQYAAITFDMCYYDCFLAWTLGFTLCAAEQDQLLNNLTHAINTLNVNLLDLTPSVAVSLKRVDVPKVKWLYCIGEAMSPEIIRRWKGACVNSYGPTEAAFCTTMFQVQEAIKPSVIGTPFASTSFVVLNSRNEKALPIFAVGELCIGGAQLAREYYSRPELTAEKFVNRSGQKLYKSGDLVRMLGDGNFEFVGRVDDQVKIRGQRVELGEIDHVLQNCDDRIIAVTTQILTKAPSAKEQLVAFLVPQSRIPETETADVSHNAKTYSSKMLPSYMVPQFFIMIDKIPKSTAGKIDKKALTQIFRDYEEAGSLPNGISENHNWTQTELFVREVFAQLSKIPSEEVYLTTSIYQLGLDSINAVQIAAALRKSGYTVNAGDVMRNVNCLDLAAFLDLSQTTSSTKPQTFDFDAFESKHKAAVHDLPGIQSDTIQAIRPCTPFQNGIISQFLSKDGLTYFNYLRLKLEVGTELSRLTEAWTKVIDRHIMLRTGFAHVKDSGTSNVMVHYHTNPVGLHLDKKPKKQHSESVDQWRTRVQHHSMKNLHLPPWRVRVVRDDNMLYLDLALLHSLFDAQSLHFILSDLRVAYKGQEIVSVPLVDPALNTILTRGNIGNSGCVAFWEKLGREATPTRFPNLTPLRKETLPAQVLSKLSSQSLTEMESGCRSANISLQSAGIASWSSILSAYTGQQSVTCGIVLSGRDFEGAESVVFPCITTIPFVCEISDNKHAMLKAVMALSAEIQSHQFTPLNEIPKLMGYPNEALFDTIFAYQKISNYENREDSWQVVDERASIEYPISIELEPKKGRLEYRLTFLPRLLPEEQALLVLDQLDHLMQSFIFSNELSVADSPKLPSLYSITPPKHAVLPSEAKLLHGFIEATARDYPDSIAFEFANSIRDGQYSSTTWTYAELDREGNKIAHLLKTYNVHPGALVAVCFEKCPEASFAMLGVLKAGCAFVAVDPGAPNARKAFIVEDSGAPIVLTTKMLSSDFAVDARLNVISLDTISLQNMPPDKPQLEREIAPEDRSYCLYTSGTTGTPKGCELTHENAVQAILSFQRLFAGHWDKHSRWLQFASFHFDVSVLEQYWSWSVGICVISAPRDLIFEDLAASIRTLNVTHIDLTPSLARILHPDDVPSLCKGVFITGGESLKQEILDVWGPKGVIYNGYGPTEATIGVTMYPRVPTNGKPSNIGPQFDNVGSLVLRPNSDTPVLRGGIGELCVYGKLVGKGYLNRPELTEERFPHLSRFNLRVYRTGDLVRILHDGSFDFLGRADDQIKLRGQRLEIGEINSVIKKSGNSDSDVATLVLKHPTQQRDQLVSFIAVASKSKGDSRILLEETKNLEAAREACQDKLPGYMVPTHLVAVSMMPLSANNKADAKKLKDMYEALSAAELQKLSAESNASSEKWSKLELKIRHVIADTLKIGQDTIKKTVSFFELGMDSISVVGVSHALKQVKFSKASASLVMRNPSIRRLAKALSSNNLDSDVRGSIIAAKQSITAIQHRHRRMVARSLSIDTREIEALAPCTPLQQGMIARSLESDQGLYFNTFRFDLAGDIDEEKLHTAWSTVYCSTQILRTVFMNTEDGYVQAVLGKSPLPWKSDFIGIGQSLNEYLEKARSDWLQSNQTDIQRPLEVILVNTPQSKVLVVHIFHALYDGISIDFVFESILDAYNDRLQDTSGPSFLEAIPYGPLRNIEGAKEFWMKHLADESFKPIPSTNDDTSAAPQTIKRELHNLPNFEATRRELNVTSRAIVQACWSKVLQDHLKGSVVLGLVVSGRSIDFEGADRIVGPLFNTIPFHHQTLPDDTWTSIIKNTHEFNVAAHPYQHTPLRDIMKWCGRNANHPLFETLFVHQISEKTGTSTDNSFWTLTNDRAEADYPLAIEVEQWGSDSFKLTLIAQGNIADEKKLSGMLDEFEENILTVLYEKETKLKTTISEDENTEFTSMNNTRLDNAVLTSPDCDFEWTDNAIALREEIASLSGTEIGDINETTSIFELGLDSIDAIKLSSQLKKRSIHLPTSRIMRGLTIAKIAPQISTISKMQDQEPFNSEFRTDKERLESYVQRRGLTRGVAQVFPATPLQEAMIAEMVASNYTRYYNHDVLKIFPETNVEKLRNAWMDVVDNSPILRTSFIDVDDPSIESSFAQLIHQLPHKFWTNISVDGQPDFGTILETIREDAVQVGLSQPLFHVKLVESSDEKYLIISIAHALYDGWSLGLLHTDVKNAYQGFFQSRPGYETTLGEILQSSGSDPAGFWRDFLSGINPSSFPRRIQPRDTKHQTVHRKEQSSTKCQPEVSAFARKNGITIQTLGQTVFAFVLASYVQSFDVFFGSVLSGRDDETTSKLLFPTMNTVAIRTIIHGTRRDMLHYVQENFNNIKQYQHFPLRKALSLTNVQGSSLEGLFIYQKTTEEKEDENVQLYHSVEGHSDVEYPICVELEVVDEELVWRCAVKEEVLDGEGAQELLDRLNEVMKSIIHKPDAPAIEFTSEGTSICGLPAFEEVQDEISNYEEPEDEDDLQRYSNSPTAKTIRETLAFVSKTSKDNIKEGMTIFHMGLDSISAIKVSSLLRKHSIVLGVGEMLRAGTVEKMTQLVDERTSPSEEEEDPKTIIDEVLSGINRLNIMRKGELEEEDVQEVLPVTAGQVYMMTMWLNSDGQLFYPVFSYHVQGSVSFNNLKIAWETLVSSTPLLRTCFIATDNDHLPYVQVVLRSNNHSFLDISGMSEEQVQQSMDQRAGRQPYAQLLGSKLSTGWDLKLKIHHALYDGVSLPILMQNFQDLCNNIKPPSPPDIFHKFIASSSNPDTTSARKSFWISYLQGIQQHRLPQPTSALTSRTEVFKPALIPSISSLENLARNHGTTIHALFLAVYARLHASVTHTPSTHDVVLGIYLANRSLPLQGIESAAIPTFNLLPLRISAPLLEKDIWNTAAQIQYDLQEISSRVNTGASLYEIWQWTGVRVDVFVNFLKLPNQAEEGGNGEVEVEQEKQVRIEQTQGGEWSKSVSRITEMRRGGEFMASEHLCNQKVQEAYLHAIDVEATIRKGALDIGIFAGKEMLDLERGEELIERLGGELEQLVRDE